MKYRIVEIESKEKELASGWIVPARTLYEIQSFRNGAWSCDPRCWDVNTCGYFHSSEEVTKRFNEIVYPKPPKVILEVDDCE